MLVIAATYPGSDGTQFDRAYCNEAHMPLLTFGSMDEFKAAAAQHGAEIFADIPKFCGGSPSPGFFDAAA